MLKTDFENLRNLFRLGDRSKLRIEIRSLIGELTTSNHVDGALFYHPLGFLYATLFSFSNDETIRIHIWNKKYYNVVPQLDIHNHYYRVNSYIYKGCVFNQLYKVNDVIDVNVNQYTGSYTKTGGRILTKTDNGLFIIEDIISTYCEGDLYTINHDQIHTGGSIAGDIACTIVYTQDPGEKKPLVFGKGPLPDVLSFEVKKVPSGSIKAIFKDLETC